MKLCKLLLEATDRFRFIESYTELRATLINQQALRKKTNEKAKGKYIHKQRTTTWERKQEYFKRISNWWGNNSCQSASNKHYRSQRDIEKPIPSDKFNILNVKTNTSSYLYIFFCLSRSRSHSYSSHLACSASFFL